MDCQSKLLLIGGLISLISTLLGISLQHIFIIIKSKSELILHPFHVVYNKQIEFFDKLALLFYINSYKTTIDVWLGEKSAITPKRLNEALKNTSALNAFENIIQQQMNYMSNSRKWL